MYTKLQVFLKKANVFQKRKSRNEGMIDLRKPEKDLIAISTHLK